jgi:competence protein ComEA
VEPSNAPWRVLEAEPQGQGDVPDRARDLPWVAIGALLIAVVIGGSALLLAMRPDPGVVVSGVTDATGDGGTAGADVAETDSSAVVVEVGGAVLRPGVYTLPGGSRVMDAVSAAGGFGPRVDAALADRQLNLAATVRDGDEIHVPARGEAATGSGVGATGGGAEPQAGSIDLNTATAEALDTLPGVGPATAAKIIAAREEQPFASVDELGTRKVLGPATLEKIRTLVSVGP